MPHPNPPWLACERGRWFVRRRPAKRIWLSERYGTKAFWEEYKDAVEGTPRPRASKPGVNTLAWLVGRYKDSAAYSALAMSSRVQRDNVLKRIITTAGHQPYRAITRAHVIKGIDDRKDRPAAARHFVEAIRGVYRWALDAGLVIDDPTRDVRVKAKRTDGHHTWTAEEMARFEACHPIGTRARVAYAVLLYAGLRRGDAVRYGRQHVKDGIGRIVTEKNGRLAIIYHTPELDDALAAGPVGDLTFIAGERGGNMTKESFGTLFKRWCVEAGVPGTAHGLRKARAVKAAEMGLSENEMLPAFGWIQPRTAAIYTRKADQERLAESGARKMLANVKGTPAARKS